MLQLHNDFSNGKENACSTKCHRFRISSLMVLVMIPNDGREYPQRSFEQINITVSNRYIAIYMDFPLLGKVASIKTFRYMYVQIYDTLTWKQLLWPSVPLRP